jgi:hypothetical protein
LVGSGPSAGGAMTTVPAVGLVAVVSVMVGDAVGL